MAKINPAYSWKEDEANSTVQQTSGVKKATSKPSIRGGRHADVERKVRSYLMEWYETTPEEFTLDWSEIEIIVTGKLKKASAKFRVMPDGKDELRISYNIYQFDPDGLNDDAQRAARHEAVHAWQMQEHGTADHGHTFKQWMDEFDITVYAEEPAQQPKYEIKCPNCGTIAKKQRKCKTVKKIGLYSCQRCGSQNLSVKQNH